ncbi:cilia- and flagella-associated protein 299 isoform X1 [Acanthopagrus latus]|uniref:cilia- and flagella-associated protein 299 isoform X1 n=1 Tax=Acanthopagrus latus TaxID=8177 RepID=UPI00187CC88B|nr:cilia- and flagella-associated protein 299 isoform X1 [Acanthopagrus latus]
MAACRNTARERMEHSAAARVLDPIAQFQLYEDYLDSKVTPMDLFYSKSRELARKLVEHGRKGTVLSREEFEEKKAAAQIAEAAKSNTFYNRNQPATLASAGKELKDNFLKALAEREEANRSGKMTSVIFIRDHNTVGQEVSGYIDYAHRLKTQDFEPYFSGKKRLMPGRSDLCHKEHRAATPAPALASTSHLQQGRVARFTYTVCSVLRGKKAVADYYNWKTQVSTSNSSPNFEVIYNDPNGLLFKNTRDKKILNVDPLSGPGEDSNRTLLQSDLYIHVVIYDHSIRTV